ncbi:beta-hexosaminidase [Robertkochia marina]|uniref:beta-N-acetylhexosaminidase n=1 Tax=Robertkochia marina TaxID=1227945 RepID=A0A4V3UY36_9FLAO|nr:family 20 glycosylhydrolase [Robertkochia marina]THD67546.1 beta-hexosaminidase [Robertkochia marina]TRZ44586.1 beta-hexosaminidase [Robertkochia marina]
MKPLHTCLIIIISLTISNSLWANEFSTVFPIPKKMEHHDGKGIDSVALKALKTMVLPMHTLLQEEMEAEWLLDSNETPAKLRILISLDTTLKDQGYHLKVYNDSIDIRAADRSGIFYAWQTLKQLSSVKQGLEQAITIEDHPDFKRRGYMLDISRDKVPTMSGLYTLIDRLAALKYNELQLYTEHTFAYKDHKQVWQDASPMTPEEIRKLDAYCQLRNIDLVPNQNSFGHMERWLEHDSYLHLAECPENCNTIWGLRKRHSLDPTNPGSLELMQSLYAELLPNFSSDYFNIGCDETIELGLGRSAEECRKSGKGRVYLDYLKKLHRAATSHGKKVQFWGDIILNHPELIDDLPQDITALVWGYSATYPFDKNLPKFQKAGISYYVCPGTSTWRSLIGRNQNGFENLRNAATNGITYGADGFLLTDWGDHGHWQPAVISIPSIIMASSLSWNTGADPEPGLDSWMDIHIFKDPSGQFSKAMLQLGNAYTQTGVPGGNANIFHLMLHRFAWSLKGNYQTKEMNLKGLSRAEQEIKKALEILQNSKPQTIDSELLRDELKLASSLALHAIRLGKERLKVPGGDVGSIDETTRQELSDELGQLITEHRRLWTKRNRPGGLEDSAQKLKDVKNHYTESK